MKRPMRIFLIIVLLLGIFSIGLTFYNTVINRSYTIV